MEWSYKKAITIQVYGAYDPIPVPFNLISNCIALLSCLRKCTRSNIPTNKQRVSGDIYSITTAAHFERSQFSFMKAQFETDDRTHSRCVIVSFKLFLSWETDLNVKEITAFCLNFTASCRVLKACNRAKWHNKENRTTFSVSPAME